MIDRRSYLIGLGAASALGSCAPRQSSQPSATAPVEAFDPAFYKYLSHSQSWEVLSSGHQWIEGPTWDQKRQKLYFTDVPRNIAYQWAQGSGADAFLHPSGADVTHDDGFREPGANGLWYEGDTDTLLMCNHGTRTLQRLDLSSGQRTHLVQNFENKRFNSPNDVVKSRNGTIFFTDPPYGLAGLNESSLKEQDSNGVYKLTTDGHISRILEDMTFPNGVALSPDEKSLYITQSDPNAPIIRRVTLDKELEPVTNEIWLDFSKFLNDAPGLPDGLAVSEDGTLFVTGPGGVFLVSNTGKMLGRINTGKATANCTFGEDGSTLFITAGDELLRLPTQCFGHKV